ncbi:MAG: hypothetical protein ACOX8K_10115 [Lachnospiraceae bacterium]|jgi:hypothetical protein
MEHNYENCHNITCKKKSEKFGMLLACQGVKEKISTIEAELKRKGFDKPKGFSVLEGFLEDEIKQLKTDI